MKRKGIALISVLVSTLIVFLIVMAAVYISKSGYKILTMEEKYEIAEKQANARLMQAVKYVISQNKCPVNLTDVYSIPDANNQTCFIKVKGSFKGAFVLKTALIPIKPQFEGGAVLKYVSSLSVIKGVSLFTSCDPSCPVPALITGNTITGVASYQYPVCPVLTKTGGGGGGAGGGGGGGKITGLSAIALTTAPAAYLPNAFNYNTTDLTSSLFIPSSREDLIQTFSKDYQVKFLDGKPSGLINPDGNFSYKSCNATLNQIICDNGNTFIWNGSAYIKNSESYNSLEFGDAVLYFYGTFNGGGKLSAYDVEFGNNAIINPINTKLTVVAKNALYLDSNWLAINNTSFFAYYTEIEGKNLSLGDVMFYTGGTGGSLYINGTRGIFGSPGHPVLFIADNNFYLGRIKKSTIYGAIFITDKAQSFTIDGGITGGGGSNLVFNGTIVSNSLQATLILKRFTLNFNKTAIADLSKSFSFVKPPFCNQFIKFYLINTKTSLF